MSINYYALNPNDYPNCNITVNNNEYYDPTSVQDQPMLGSSSTTVQLSCIVYSCCLTLLCGAWSMYYFANSITTIAIILFIIFICCWSSLSGNINTSITNYQMSKAIIDNSESRPCFSYKQEAVLLAI